MTRLEEIKEHTAWTVDNGVVPRLDDSDLAWLIGRVEKLEKDLDVLRVKYRVTKEQREEILYEDMPKLESENHRLKQALSYYANPAIYDSRHGMEILRDSGDKARRELEGLE